MFRKRESMQMIRVSGAEDLRIFDVLQMQLVINHMK